MCLAPSQPKLAIDSCRAATRDAGIHARLAIMCNTLFFILGAHGNFPAAFQKTFLSGKARVQAAPAAVTVAYAHVKEIPPL